MLWHFIPPPRPIHSESPLPFPRLSTLVPSRIDLHHISRFLSADQYERLVFNHRRSFLSRLLSSWHLSLFFTKEFDNCSTNWAVRPRHPPTDTNIPHHADRNPVSSRAHSFDHLQEHLHSRETIVVDQRGETRPSTCSCPSSSCSSR